MVSCFYAFECPFSLRNLSNFSIIAFSSVSSSLWLTFFFIFIANSCTFASVYSLNFFIFSNNSVKLISLIIALFCSNSLSTFDTLSKTFDISYLIFDISKLHWFINWCFNSKALSCYALYLSKLELRRYRSKSSFSFQTRVNYYCTSLFLSSNCYTPTNLFNSYSLLTVSSKSYMFFVFSSIPYIFFFIKTGIP